MVTRRESIGRPISGFDAQIAAVCRSRGAVIAKNVDDVSDLGLEVIDPWVALQRRYAPSRSRSALTMIFTNSGG